MKLFRVLVRNDRDYSYSGRLEKGFFVMGNDFTEAVVKADTVLQSLAEKLRETPSLDLEDFRIASIVEEGYIDTVGTAWQDTDRSCETWIAKAAKRMKAQAE